MTPKIVERHVTDGEMGVYVDEPTINHNFKSQSDSVLGCVFHEAKDHDVTSMKEALE